MEALKALSPLPLLLTTAKDATGTYKNIEEARAATAKKNTYHSLQKQVPRLANATRDCLAKGTEACAAVKASVKSVGKSIHRASHDVSSASASVRAAAMSHKHAAHTVAEVVKEVHGVHLVVQSLAGSVAYISALLEQVVGQLDNINQNLSGIRDELRVQNTLTVQGARSGNGFAQPVYDFVKMHIDTAGNAGRDERVFLWHPDTTWHGAFHRLITENPLPASFCAWSEDLDKLCVAMIALRDSMGSRHQKRKKSKEGRDVVFHLLIPSWYDITLLYPRRFPDNVLPLHVTGMKDHGKPLVIFNLPYAQDALVLKDVENRVTQEPLGEYAGNIVHAAVKVSQVVCGFGAFVSAPALFGPAGIAAAVPLYFGGMAATDSIHDSIDKNLVRKRIRIIGSNETLDPDVDPRRV